MLFTPGAILGMWARAVLSVAIFADALYLLHRWYDALPRQQEVVVRQDSAVTTKLRPL
jgi:hypothetical protein